MECQKNQKVAEIVLKMNMTRKFPVTNCGLIRFEVDALLVFRVSIYCVLLDFEENNKSPNDISLMSCF